MQPLSPRVRTRYLYTFILLFVAVLPSVIFYADGWRWKLEDGFYKTGGIFISIPYQDADVYVNGRHIGRSGFFDRSFYIGDLAPDAYAVRVDREGYLSWSRVLIVEPQLVTDADALLFPKRIELEHLVSTGVATTGVAVLAPTEYRRDVAAFAAPIASSTIPQDEVDGVRLFVENGDVHARWLSGDTFPPSRFCGRPSFCAQSISIERGEEYVIRARLFRDGVVYATREGGVYFVEMDVRPTPLNAKLFEAADADILILDDSLVIKSDGALYRVNL
jgi:hypothetical protein